MIEIGPWTIEVDGAGAPSDGVEDEHVGGASETRVTLLQHIRDSSTGVRNAAWERFTEHYGRIVEGYARGMGLRGQDLDDITQEVFLSLHTIGRDFEYDRRRGRFRGYLHVITRNAVRTRLRRQHEQISPLMDHESAAEAPDTAWDREWAEGMVVRGLGVLQRSMRPDHYDAFERYGRRGEAVGDVAESLGMTPEQVRQIKSRGLRSLRRIVHRLERDGE